MTLLIYSACHADDEELLLSRQFCRTDAILPCSQRHIGNKVSNAQWDKHTAGSRDLATLISFLVTCVQPEMLHISLHYEWMHLRPAYLTPLLIRLQITGELLIPP